MKIDGASFEALRPLMEESFRHRLVGHLRDGYGPLLERVDDEIFREMVKNGVARARGHGLTWESSITAFVAMMIVVGPAFDTHPRAREVLGDRRTPPEKRVDALIERLSDEDWEAARRMGDAGAWFTEGA